MNLKFLFFVSITFCGVLVVGSSNGRKPKTIIERVASRIVNYYQNDNSITPKKQDTTTSYSSLYKKKKHDDKCDTAKEIEDYFFNVYANENGTISDIDSLISYLILQDGNEVYEEKQKQSICKRNECFLAKDIKNILNQTKITRENFGSICPILLYNFEMDSCSLTKWGSKTERHIVWLVGLLFSSIVASAGWSGSIVLPFIHSKMYKSYLTFMISLACGCLISTSMLKFIPLADGFDMARLHNPNSSYFFKHILIIGVIFFFFNFDRALKLIAFYKREKRNKEQEEENRMKVAFTAELPEVASTIAGADKELDDSVVNGKPRLHKSQSIDLRHIHLMGVHDIAEITDKFAPVINDLTHTDGLKHELIGENQRSKICCTSLTDGLSLVKPIGWMAIFGDGLNNFIDGLGIGAAINQGVTEGLTATISILLACIPQELGDFALLVRAGMTPFQALFYNFMSSLTTYIGFVVGCFTGQTIKTARWIFSISGAATLYIGLGVLLPEMIHEFENTELFKDKIKVTIIQLAGLSTGYVIMIILNMYEEQIQI